MSILTIIDLTIHSGNGIIVDGVNLTVQAGEWLALVGESGSGKSVTASAIGGLLPPQLTCVSGEIHLEGVNLMEKTEKEFQRVRGKDISYIFQDYQGAFTPFYTIGKQMDEMVRTHTNLSKAERKEHSYLSLKQVGLPEERVYKSYPFQLSGGQLQRAAIAMATILKPKLLIADEPTTALDSLTSMKVLDLINQLRKKTNCGVLFITHDLRHVRKYADNVAIMYRGKIVEYGKKEAVFQHLQHPYTKQLFAAIPPLRETPSRLLEVKEKEVI